MIFQGDFIIADCDDIPQECVDVAIVNSFESHLFCRWITDVEARYDCTFVQIVTHRHYLPRIIFRSRA